VPGAVIAYLQLADYLLIAERVRALAATFLRL